MALKLHLYSDIHSSRAVCERIADRAAEADAIVIAGDVGNLRRGLDGTVKLLRRISTPTVLVPGNSESFEELQAACSSWQAATVLHGSTATVADLTFFGIGGGIPVTPFGAWSWDFSEKQAQKLLSNLPAGAILVSHSPPKGAVDRSSSGQSLGSTAVRDAILENGPRLVVCGHIHESGGQQAMVGESLVVNAGPRGFDWEIQAACRPLRSP